MRELTDKQWDEIIEEIELESARATVRVFEEWGIPVNSETLDKYKEKFMMPKHKHRNRLLN